MLLKFTCNGLDDGFVWVAGMFFDFIKKSYFLDSSIGSVRFAIPQGSALGPLLFSIYLSDLKNLGLIGKLYMSAADICLLYPFKYEFNIEN